MSKPREILLPFVDDMVLAIMAGRKTNTRRELKCGSNAIHYGRRIGDWPLSRAPYCITQEEVDNGDWKWHYSGSRIPVVGDWLEECQIEVDDYASNLINLPHQIGDRIGVRESAKIIDIENGHYSTSQGGRVRLKYRADGAESDWIEYPSRLKWLHIGKSIPNGVFREGVRTWLEVTGVRIERLNEISEADAIAEGVEHTGDRIQDGKSTSHGVSVQTAFASLWESIYGEDSFDDKWVIVTEFEVLHKGR